MQAWQWLRFAHDHWLALLVLFVLFAVCVNLVRSQLRLRLDQQRERQRHREMVRRIERDKFERQVRHLSSGTDPSMPIPIQAPASVPKASPSTSLPAAEDDAANQQIDEDEQELHRWAEQHDAEMPTELASAWLIEMDHLDEDLQRWEEDEARRLGGPCFEAAGDEAAEAIRPSDHQLAELRLRIEALSVQLHEAYEELDYVTSRIETSVDFFPSHVRHTIERWKSTEVARNQSFEDLKQRFRYQAYSIDDGLELFYNYREWLKTQHPLLLGLSSEFGLSPRPNEPILALLGRIEQAEWHRALGVNMDVINGCQVLRSINDVLLEIQQRISDLGRACSRRSRLIVQPDWEPRGLL